VGRVGGRPAAPAAEHRREQFGQFALLFAEGRDELVQLPLVVMPAVAAVRAAGRVDPVPRRQGEFEGDLGHVRLLGEKL
jgi:hypothetical protein